MLHFFKLGAVALFCGVGGNLCAATLQTFDFTAVSNEGGIATGLFSYDLAQPDLDPTSGLGRYVGGFEVSVTGGALDGGFQSVSDADIFLNDGSGFVLFPSGIGVATHFVQIADLGLNFGEELPALLDFVVPSLLFDVVLRSDEIGLPGPFEQVFFEIDTLTLRETAPSPVPIPGGLPLLLSGLLGVVAFKRFTCKT